MESNLTIVSILNSITKLMAFATRAYGDDEVLIYMVNNMSAATKKAHREQFEAKVELMNSIFQELKTNSSASADEASKKKAVTWITEVKTHLRQVLPPEYIKQLDSL